MNSLGRRTILGTLAVLAMPMVGWAHEDHPLLSGMPGYTIRSKEVMDFESITLDPKREIAQQKGAVYSGPVTFEGKTTKLIYRHQTSPKPSLIQVYRNYKAAIESLGGKQLNSPGDDLGYLWHVFEIRSPGKPLVSVLVRMPPHVNQIDLTIVEQKAMEQVVKATQLADEISQSGFATLYINFDTNQAVLKDDGIAAVKEIVQLLKQQPKLKLSIEGHTDNVGQAADNKRLSQARAAAVMKAVVAEGGDAARLASAGHGSESPIADNRNEAGRAKNRRVELVKVN